jgi:hypothetical protein
LVATFIYWLLTLASVVNALLEEEAGLFDFVIRTTGHGSVRQAEGWWNDDKMQNENNYAILTSGNGGCYLANRSLLTGTLTWRRQVCGTTSLSSSFRFARVRDIVVTASDIDETDQEPGGTNVRAWHVLTGDLLWDKYHPHQQRSNSNNNNNNKAAEGIKTLVWKVSDKLVALSPDPHGKNTIVLMHVDTGNVIEDDQSAVISRKDAIEAWKHQSEQTQTCGPFSFAVQDGELTVSKTGNDSSIINTEIPCTSLWVVECAGDRNKVSLLLTDPWGTTKVIQSDNVVSSSPQQQQSWKTLWQAEEGLGQVSTGIMLDASHEDMRNSNRDILAFSSRIQLQIENLKSIWKPDRSRRDAEFGFHKIAILLANSTSRLYGIYTNGPSRGQIRYTVSLPPEANWHRLVHGSINARRGEHGIHGIAHTRDLLILSRVANGVEWKCLDGTTGQQLEQGSIEILNHNIQQIIPVEAKQGSCRQSALLMLEDESILPVPNDSQVMSIDTLHAHIIDKDQSSLVSFGVSVQDNNAMGAYLVGNAIFHDETIVTVAYPQRDEVVQSPCNVLGDDSLLLKYLNPHLAVIVTMKSSTAKMESDGEAFLFDDRSKTGAGGSKQKRKPTGVTQSGEEVTSTSNEEKPNLFVNLVDTVSGRIIHRVSHTNARARPQPKVIISENWVFYAFTNEKTKKAELGVLSLYEGMIDSKGLTAFTSPDQTTSFSSLDARESKPVVLAKVFSLPKAMTALGVTTTRAGISGRRLVLAGIDGQIHAVDRRILEPRRPLGQLKESEKKEGLMQYHELVQLPSLMSLSYNQTIESVESIITAPTDLESQTLILAFGGPDIFFTRMAPSRGFDLLPDSFNKPLLSLVVAALIVILVVLQRANAKKIIKHGWV